MIWFVLCITMAVAWTALLWVWRIEENERFQKDMEARRRERWWDY